MADDPKQRIAELSRFDRYRQSGCDWCAKHLAGDDRVTDVLEQSHPRLVHKVYPPHVDTPFSQYLECTAPLSVYEWSEQRIAELEEALRRAEESLNCANINFDRVSWLCTRLKEHVTVLEKALRMLSNAATSFIHLDEIWNTTSSNIKVFAGIISKSQQALAHPTAPHAATAAMKATAEAKDL